MNGPFLADTSAWHRAGHPEVAPVWVDRMERYLIATCPPVRLELLFSARSRPQYDRLRVHLDGLRQLDCDGAVFARAEEVQAMLGRKPLHHRSVKLNDLLIAAAAELGGATLWHYDEDYDRIAGITGQPAEWIAPRGTLP